MSSVSNEILVVTDAFTTRGSGVLVEPRVTFDGNRAPFPVVLRLPGGEERNATAVFEVAHIQGRLAPYAMLRVLEKAPADVPKGTTIFHAGSRKTGEDTP